ncbi:MAG: amidase family protein [Cyanobacteria bacterium J06623_4]
MVEQSAAVSNTFEIEEATIAQLQTAMAQGKLSVGELVSHYLTRIDRLDAKLNSIIALNPKAEAIAETLDKERAAGEVRGPLHGIPLVVKDNINTVELPTTGGCIALSELQPAADAFVVSQLKAAGAIVLAKANLHELAQRGESVSGLGGQARNPYNLDYTPGGSSGGSAAAIAANFAVAGLGTDTVNSVRSPAAACNLVGLRPTIGLVSRAGLMPVALSQDVIGPMGRSVADVAILLTVMAVDDPDDPTTARSANYPTGNYSAALKKEGVAGMRLGIVPSLLGRSPAYNPVEPVADGAIATLQSLGAQCDFVPAEIDIDGLHAELSLERWEFKLHFEQYLERLGTAAPLKTLKALLRSGKVHSSIRAQLEDAEAICAPLGSDEYWQRLYPRRVELRQRLNTLFRRQRLDALVYPHQRRQVARVGEQQAGRNGFLAAASGFPAITVPAGFDDDGLPVGLELMAMPFQEAKLLQMAYAYEQATQWRRQPAL